MLYYVFYMPLRMGTILNEREIFLTLVVSKCLRFELFWRIIANIQGTLNYYFVDIYYFRIWRQETFWSMMIYYAR
jgi:hypothetical protein